MNNLRKRILTAAYRARTGHIPSALSCLEIVWTVHQAMSEGDVFVMSKGHGCLALYAVLEEQGKLPAGELDNFAKPGGILGGHPSHNIPGVMFSTGSLGHGLALAAGLALGWRAQGEKGRKVYVLLGDGECQEGSVYEAVSLIAELDLPIVAIVDDNRTHLLNTKTVFYQLGWSVWSADGHNARDIRDALQMGEPPLLVRACTTKGKGIARMEADPMAWHHRAPNDDEYREMCEEL